MRVLAIVPAYNEEECLANTINNLVATCPDVDYVVINDGSADRTWEIVERNGMNGVCLPVNTGLTSAFRTGMKYALRHGYDAAVQFDADGQHDPRYIEPMAQEMVSSNADIVIASRFLDGKVKPSGARGAGSRLISRLIRVTTGTQLTDPTSGMRMYNRSMIEMFAKGFDVAPEPDTVALAARKGRRVVEVPVIMHERQGGESYLKLSSVIRYMSRTCLSILLFQWFR